MNVHFKYPRTLESKHYVSGTHVVPDTLADHWFFKGLIAAKDIEILECAQPEELRSVPTLKDDSILMEEELETVIDVCVPKSKNKKRGNR